MGLSALFLKACLKQKPEELELQPASGLLRNIFSNSHMPKKYLSIVVKMTSSISWSRLIVFSQIESLFVCQPV